MWQMQRPRPVAKKRCSYPKISDFVRIMGTSLGSNVQRDFLSAFRGDCMWIVRGIYCCVSWFHEDSILMETWISGDIGNGKFHEIGNSCSIIGYYLVNYFSMDSCKMLWEIEKWWKNTSSNSFLKKRVFLVNSDPRKCKNMQRGSYCLHVFDEWNIKKTYIPIVYLCLFCFGWNS